MVREVEMFTTALAAVSARVEKSGRRPGSNMGRVALAARGGRGHQDEYNE